jgi:hypothetical protein
VHHLGRVRNQTHGGGAFGNGILIDARGNRDGFDSSGPKQRESSR